MSQTAKVFLIGRDPVTGDVILSRKPESWDGFLCLLQDDVAPGDYLGEKERNQAAAVSRNPLEGVDE